MVKNVIIVNDFAYIQGGADAVAITSAIDLARKGIHVVFFSGVSPIEKMLLDARIDVICIEKKDILHDRNRINAAIKGIYDKTVEKAFFSLMQHYSNKDTIIHVHTWTKALSSAVFSIATLLNFKIVLTLHDYFSICPNGGLFNYQKNEICRNIPMSSKCILSNCDKRNYAQKQWRVIRQLRQNREISKIEDLFLIAVSKKVAEKVRDHIPNKNAKIIYLANSVEPLSNKPIDIRPNLAYLFMGRLEDEKGPELFCKAISQLGLKGVVVGDGQLKIYLQQKYPDILFTGWLTGEAKLEVIKTCKCLVFTSKLYETFGLVVAEMKSLGIPAIIPKENAAAEQITDGYDGITYQIGDIDSLCKALLKFEKMNLREMQNHVLKSFNENTNSKNLYIDHLIEIYDSIAT